MRKESSNWDLETFIKSRSFDELTSVQQQWVLHKTTLQDYEEQRWALLSVQDFLRAEEVPVPPPIEQVLEKFRASRPQQGTFAWLQNWTSWQVPVWQLGMALLCGWLLGQWNVGEKNSSLGLVPQIVYQTDTIVREIPVYIGLGKQKWAMLTDSQAQEKQRATPVVPPVSTNSQSTNNSIARDRELLNLAVGMQ